MSVSFLGGVARGVSAGLDSYENARQARQLEQLNAQRLEAGKLQIDNAKRQRDEQQRQLAAEQAMREWQVNNNVAALSKYFDETSSGGVRHLVLPQPDGAYQFAQRFPSGEETADILSEDELGARLAYAGHADPLKLYQEDLARARAVRATQDERAFEREKLGTAHQHELEQIDRQEIWDRGTQLLKAMTQGGSTASASYKEYYARSKDTFKPTEGAIDDRWPDKTATAAALAVALEQAQPGVNQNEIWRQTLDMMRIREADPNYMISMQEAQKKALASQPSLLSQGLYKTSQWLGLDANKPEVRTPGDLYQAGGRSNPPLVPGFGLLGPSEAPALGATARLPDAPAKPPKPKAPFKEAQQINGAWMVPVNGQMVQIDQGLDGKWYGKDPLSGKYAPYVGAQ